MSSFIFNFRKLPFGFILALTVVLCAEIFLFSRASVLVDRSRFCDSYKANVIKSGPDFDVLIFGESRTLAIDAKMLENASQEKITAYNFALPGLGSALEFYMSLKKYLLEHKKPKIIMLAVSIEYFDVNFKGELAVYPIEMDGVPYEVMDKISDRFCAYFPPHLVFTSVPFYEMAPLSRYYIKQIIPSIRYEKFINALFPIKIFINRFDLYNNLIRKNSLLEKTIKAKAKYAITFEKTNGQMLLSGESKVGKGEILSAMPEKKKDIKKGVLRDKFLEKFVELADRNDIPTVFFFMPIIDSRYKKMEELGWFDYADERLSGYEKKYKHFKYYRGADVGYNKRYFGDWSHLNRWGAYRFNREFIGHFSDILNLFGLGAII